MNPMLPKLLQLLLALCIASAAAAQSNVEEILARANKQFELNAFNLALRTYEQALKEQPNNAQALARSGDCYFYLNRPQDALGWYERALQSDPSPSEVMFRYGRALMHTGDYLGAKKWFLAYAALNSTVGQHYAQMCDFALQASRREGIFKALNEPISTASADFAPAFYGDQIVYSSSRSDIKRRTSTKSSSDWTGSAHNQLFVTRRGPDGYLQNPTFLREDLENTFNDGPVSFSANKRRVAYCRNSFMDGTRQISEKGMSLSLYVADVVEGKWVNERAFPYNGSDYATGFPYLSADGNTLYFASDRPGGMGGWDLYVSTWNGSAWSVPKNLGAPINTPGNEITPFVEDDILYFASDWHPGLGGFDVFRIELSDFGTPQVFHLGTGINSSRDDYGFIFDARSGYGYLTSNRPGGRGHEDLWQVRKQVDEFTIEVVDAQQRPISYAEIDFSACSSAAGIRQTDAAGRYTFQTPAGRANCQATVRKDGYQPATVSIRTAGDKSLKVVLANDGAAARSTTSPFSATAPVTYSTTPDNDDIPVRMGNIERFTVTVTDPNGRPMPGAEINLTACDLGIQRTDENGQAAFYYPANSECNLIVRKSGHEDVFIALHQQAGRDLAVRLKPSNRMRYGGIVRDMNTGRPLADVQVTARAESENHETVAISDAAGKYNLSLKPNLNYKVIYEKEGYLKGVASVYSIAHEDNANYPMMPDPAAKPVQYSTVTPGSSPGMISIDELDASKPSSTAKPRKPSSPATKGEAFAIQLAANPEDFSASRLRRYSEYTSLGNLYTVREGNLYKLRLGAYPSREQADAALAQIAPTITDAFVVRETQVNPELLVSSTPSASVQSVKSPMTYSTPTAPAQRYAVQVASSPADKPLQLNDYARLSNLGTAYIRTENNVMHVRLGPWDTPAQAEAARAEAARQGFPGAVVVVERSANPSGTSAEPRSGSFTSMSVSAMPTTPNTYSAPSTTTPSAAAPLKEYYIRLSAMENPDNFNPRQVEGVGGRLEKWPLPDGKMTAIMLTGFTDLEEAKRATDRLRAGAFPDAYIIQNEQGKMSRNRY
ncbi:MAG: carboxypeptidase regulatory-like domain-containing protein [Saprospiraceae bacterium]|nr:carboxypeptidase regulatory-like domain-containing protein [Saprospiraceae bacterium]